MKEDVSLFHFKQFSVQQNLSAMKIGTDGVLLGAWAEVENGSDILDVGSGTGIISLMLAQRFPQSNITAMEISTDAASESERNFSCSPWGDRLRVINSDFRNHSFRSKEFDCIVSNPPFFNNGIKSPDAFRAKARHDDTLSAIDIIRFGARLLSKTGKISLITPADLEENLIYEATLAGLTPTRLTRVCSVEGKKPIRLLSEFSSKASATISDVLVIRDKNNSFSDNYINLVKDFYINL